MFVSEEADAAPCTRLGGPNGHALDDSEVCFMGKEPKGDAQVVEEGGGLGMECGWVEERGMAYFTIGGGAANHNAGKSQRRQIASLTNHNTDKSQHR